MAAANDKPEARVEMDKWLASFAAKTGWTPGCVEHVAGALPYTKYNFLTRWVMKRIAREQGNATDTTRDHEYTDWEALGGFADAFVTMAANEAQPAA